MHGFLDPTPAFLLPAFSLVNASFLLLGGVLALGVVVGIVLLAITYVMGLMRTQVQYVVDKQTESLREISSIVRETANSTVTGVVREVLGEARGQVNEPVKQHDPSPEQDLNNPAWTKWDDGPENEHEIGVGDSVFFDWAGTGVQEGEMRTVGIDEGESIIPGVPLPDMTGERFQG